MMLLTQENKRKLPAIGSTARQDDPVAYVKWFTPWSNWTWYACEYDPETQECFGLVYGMAAELGHFSLAEIAAVTGPFGLKVERDIHFRPTPLSQCMDPGGALENPLKLRIESSPEADSGEHDPNKCGCEYRGNDMWSCGHIDNAPEVHEVTAEDGTVVRLHIHDEMKAEEVAQLGRTLKPTWCECSESEFLCYPGDGECTCGTHKHHVHCKKCGGISQVG